MPNIEEARAGIMSAHQNAQQGLNELTSAHRSLEDSQNALRHGTEGSNQAEADQARKRFGNAKSISSAQFNADEESKTMDYEKQVGTSGLQSGHARLC